MAGSLSRVSRDGGVGGVRHVRVSPILSRLRTIAVAVERRASAIPAVGRVLHAPKSVYAAVHGYRFTQCLGARPAGGPEPPRDANAIEAYFDLHTDGPGIWKWRHYFAVYERHLAKFVGREVHVAEVGVFGGGSLGMWRRYFGERSQVYGIDQEPGCRIRADTGIGIVIGDQSSPSFWAAFRADVPRLDVLIDDGGHEPHQQIATLEGVLAHLQPGGVYICEDVHGAFQPYHSYIDGLSRLLHNVNGPPLGMHHHIASVHIYPGIIVIEKPDHSVRNFEAPRRGSDWRPFG